jgi:hypothetical protein
VKRKKDYLGKRKGEEGIKKADSKGRRVKKMRKFEEARRNRKRTKKGEV